MKLPFVLTIISDIKSYSCSALETTVWFQYALSEFDVCCWELRPYITRLRLLWSVVRTQPIAHLPLSARTPAHEGCEVKREGEASSRLNFGMECEEDKPTSTVLKQMQSTFVLSTVKVEVYIYFQQLGLRAAACTSCVGFGVNLPLDSGARSIV
jgi:hypothetical protein